jgi:hypothetical protein
VNGTARLTLALLPVLAACGSACSSSSARYDQALQSAADEVIRLAKAHPVERLAVVDLSSGDDRTTSLGRLLADDLNGKLGSRADTLDFDLCARDGLAALIAEHKLEASGVTDRRQAAEFGRFCAAQVVVWGRYWLLGDRLKVTFDILDSETAVQIGSAGLEVPLSEFQRQLDGGTEIRPLLTTPRGAKLDDKPDDRLPQTSSCDPFTLTLLDCTFSSDDDLHCHLQVENEAPGAYTLEVGGTSLLVDNQADAYLPSRLVVGTETLDLDPGERGERDDDHQLSYEIPGNTTVNASVVFHSIGRREKKAQLLRVDLGRHGKAEFRGFLFSRQ